MDTRGIAVGYRLAHWAQVLQTRRERGQSIKDFCESEGIRKNAYFYWQRKLRKEACNEFVEQEIEARSLHVPGGWTRLEPPELPNSQEGISSLTIDVGGCIVSVNSGTDPELLSKVCRLLKTL